MARPKKEKEAEKLPEENKVSTEKRIDRLISKYEQDYCVKRGSDIVTDPKTRTVYPIDYIIDGGISQSLGGHKLEFFGAESSGKTSFSYMIMGQYQKQEKICAYINAENSYDIGWASVMGVDPSKLIVITPETLEQAGDVLLELVKEVDLVVIDSIVALVPEEEIEKSLSDKTMASQAKVISPLCRKLNQALADKKAAIIFINQMREKVGVMYGSPETTSGGRALKHLYDTRVLFKLGQPIYEGTGDNKEQIGVEIKIHCKKNKKGKPQRTTVVDFYYSGKIDTKKCLFFAALKSCVISLEGQSYTFKEHTVRGKDNFIAELTEPEWEAVEKEVYEKLSK